MKFFCHIFFVLVFFSISSISHGESFPDEYEEDDTIQLSQKIHINETQTHNFHNEKDIDWVMFYGFAGYDYDIKVKLTNNEENLCNVVIELYDYDSDGIEKLKKRDNGVQSEDEKMYWVCGKDDFYFVKISSKTGSCDFSRNTEYQLSVSYPEAMDPIGDISGYIYVSGTEDKIGEVLIISEGNQTDDKKNYVFSDSADGAYYFQWVDFGKYTLIAIHKAYKISSLQVNVDQADNPVNANICMEPIYCKKGDVNKDGIVDIKDFKDAYNFAVTPQEPDDQNIFCAANLVTDVFNDSFFISIEDVKGIFDMIAGK